MVDGIATGAIACLLFFGCDKVLGLNIHPSIYVGVFIGNLLYHTVIKKHIGL